MKAHSDMRIQSAYNLSKTAHSGHGRKQIQIRVGKQNQVWVGKKMKIVVWICYGLIWSKSDTGGKHNETWVGKKYFPAV